ncbi:MAG TPA: pyridoxamine 5'-phosphate oxidase family protein [Actinomycetota bacterium]|nr:pyridoxamine 5'-phosphate oxidase family protein [Actinomycetota bacterium]
MPRPDLSMTRSQIDGLLARPNVGVLSTIDAGGFPHSVGMYYVPVAGGVEMWPYGKSQKVKNIERDPRCALLVESGQPYVDLQGVLLRGRAEIDRDPERVFALGRSLYQRYFQPTTGIPFDEGPHERIRAQSMKRVRVVFTTERIASWDHAKGNRTGGTP